jgi:DNA-binding SARP family transcriptional activator/Tfp pilus assembly protein PilF
MSKHPGRRCHGDNTAATRDILGDNQDRYVTGKHRWTSCDPTALGLDGGLSVTAALEFALLGPLLVRDRSAELRVAPGGQRAVLAALLLDVGQVVADDELTEVVWGASPPVSARAALRNLVSRLRASLGNAERGLILRQPPGYLIGSDGIELDVSRFEALVAAARTASRDGQWGAAAAQAGGALALWRGEPLADAGSELLAIQHAPRLAEMRLLAYETKLGADLSLGRHADAVPELRRLAAAHPLRENLHAQLMLALYRDGRQGEALDAYQHARQVLIGELGTEPGVKLQDLHRQILAGDAALTAQEPGAATGSGPGLVTAAAPAQIVPRQLPGAVRHFVGRGRELAALSALLVPESGQPPGTVVISAIGGTAGVGKTALALQWAHRVADRFPDGQLYVNLRGYDPDQPVAAADALAGFLRALGMPGEQIPADTQERAAAYRSLLAGQRVLVVLDNAREADQVRPLLPGGSSCAVVVTSRDAQAALVARDGAARLELDLLQPGDAADLLCELIGDRSAADPDATAVLAACCCRLPLALRVAAEIANARPGTPLADLAGELAVQQDRLDLLDAGRDARTAVRAVFSWSYRHLDDATARAFRLAGLHPGPDLEIYAIAALTDTTAAQAGRLLGQLARAHLIQPAAPGRYSMHDLLGDYARELAVHCDSDDQRRAALTRLFDHYLHTAATAMNALAPAERHLRPAIPQPATPAPPVGHAAQARAWLDAERASLVTVAAHAAAHDWPGHATRLSAILYRYLHTAAYYPEASTIHACARRAAHNTGDQAAEADALTGLGVVDWEQGRYPQAAEHLQQALALYRETGDRPGQARAFNNLGIADWGQGRYVQAADHYRQALALYRETGDRHGEAHVLNNLGNIERRAGRYPQATSNLEQALALYRETGDRNSEASVLNNLGDVELWQGRYPQATSNLEQAVALCRETGNRNSLARVLDSLGTVELRQGRYPQATSNLEQALALCRETGDQASQADVLNSLGTVELRQGRYPQATSNLEQALALRRETGDQAGEAETLNGLGEVSLAAGQSGQARTRHAAALALASQTGDKYQEARARHGLGSACAAGDPGQARRYWQQALTLYTELGTPEAGQVRAALAADPPSP